MKHVISGTVVGDHRVMCMRVCNVYHEEWSK